MVDTACYGGFCQFQRHDGVGAWAGQRPDGVRRIEVPHRHSEPRRG